MPLHRRRQRALDRITLDDGRTNQNPDPAIHPNGGVFDLDQSLPRWRHGRQRDRRAGLRVRSVPDPAHPGSRLHEHQPAHRRARPVGGRLQVATFNVLNYFTTIDDSGHDSAGPSATRTVAAPTTRPNSTRQRDKIIGRDRCDRCRRRRPDRDRERRHRRADRRPRCRAQRRCRCRHLRLRPHRFDRDRRDPHRAHLQARLGHPARRLRRARLARSIRRSSTRRTVRRSPRRSSRMRPVSAVHGRRQSPQVEGIVVRSTSATPTSDDGAGKLQPHADGGRDGPRRLSRHRSDRQRRPRLPDHRRPQPLRKEDPIDVLTTAGYTDLMQPTSRVRTPTPTCSTARSATSIYQLAKRVAVAAGDRGDRVAHQRRRGQRLRLRRRHPDVRVRPPSAQDAIYARPIRYRSSDHDPGDRRARSRSPTIRRARRCDHDHGTARDDVIFGTTSPM